MARCILHLDLDCFYVQVEMLRLSLPPERPCAVTQKFLVVTCNYAARAAGVTKLMATESARQRCPDLLLVSGEDLTPYREASDAVFEELCQVGPVQRLGLDEFFIDATAAAAAALLDESAPGWEAQTHVHRATLGTTTAEKLAGVAANHRPMDLRAAANAPAAAPWDTFAEGEAGGGDTACDEGGETSGGAAGSALLRAGSHVAAATRRAVRARTGLTCSAGVAGSKLVAKLVGGLHKPDSQTAIEEAEARAFLAPLPVRVLPGVGGKAEARLHALGARHVHDLAALPRPQLIGAVGAAAAPRLAAAASTGVDPEPVRHRETPPTTTPPQKNISARSRRAAVRCPRDLARAGDAERPSQVAVRRGLLQGVHQSRAAAARGARAGARPAAPPRARPAAPPPRAARADRALA